MKTYFLMPPHTLLTELSSRQLELDLPYLLADVSRLLRRRFAERMADFSLTEAQWRVTGFLGKSEGLTQTELSELIGLQKAPLGEHIDKLEAMGWIVRESDPLDRRVNRLYLTTFARDKAQVISERYQQLSAELKSNISPLDWQQLQEILDRLANQFLSESTITTLSQLNVDRNLQVISLLNRQLSKQFDDSLKTLGFTRSQWLVLVATIHQEGIRQTDLGKMLDIAKAPLGQIIDELENQRWLQRQQDTLDRRVNRLLVTDSAKPMINTLINDYKNIHEGISTLLGENDLATAMRICGQLQKRLLSLSQRQPTIKPSCSELASG